MNMLELVDCTNTTGNWGHETILDVGLSSKLDNLKLVKAASIDVLTDDGDCNTVISVVDIKLSFMTYWDMTQIQGVDRYVSLLQGTT